VLLALLPAQQTKAHLPKAMSLTASGETGPIHMVSIRGLFVGEQQALGLLRDYSRTYNERFDGFVVREFNGGLGENHER
jgi:hypothetical protein